MNHFNRRRLTKSALLLPNTKFPVKATCAGLSPGE